jgi:hypothetical protein
VWAAEQDGAEGWLTPRVDLVSRPIRCIQAPICQQRSIVTTLEWVSGTLAEHYACRSQQADITAGGQSAAAYIHSKT